MARNKISMSNNPLGYVRLFVLPQFQYERLMEVPQEVDEGEHSDENENEKCYSRDVYINVANDREANAHIAQGNARGRRGRGRGRGRRYSPKRYKNARNSVPNRSRSPSPPRGARNASAQASFNSTQTSHMDIDPPNRTPSMNDMSMATVPDLNYDLPPFDGPFNATPQAREPSENGDLELEERLRILKEVNEEDLADLYRSLTENPDNANANANAGADANATNGGPENVHHRRGNNFNPTEIPNARPEDLLHPRPRNGEVPPPPVPPGVDRSQIDAENRMNAEIERSRSNDGRRPRPRPEDESLERSRSDRGNKSKRARSRSPSPRPPPGASGMNDESLISSIDSFAGRKPKKSSTPINMSADEEEDNNSDSDDSDSDSSGENQDQARGGMHEDWDDNAPQNMTLPNAAEAVAAAEEEMNDVVTGDDDGDRSSSVKTPDAEARDAALNASINQAVDSINTFGGPPQRTVLPEKEERTAPFEDVNRRRDEIDRDPPPPLPNEATDALNLDNLSRDRSPRRRRTETESDSSSDSGNALAEARNNERRRESVSPEKEKPPNNRRNAEEILNDIINNIVNRSRNDKDENEAKAKGGLKRNALIDADHFSRRHGHEIKKFAEGEEQEEEQEEEEEEDEYYDTAGADDYNENEAEEPAAYITADAEDIEEGARAAPDADNEHENDNEYEDVADPIELKRQDERRKALRTYVRKIIEGKKSNRKKFPYSNPIRRSSRVSQTIRKKIDQHPDAVSVAAANVMMDELKKNIEEKQDGAFGLLKNDKDKSDSIEINDEDIRALRENDRKKKVSANTAGKNILLRDDVNTGREGQWQKLRDKNKFTKKEKRVDAKTQTTDDEYEDMSTEELEVNTKSKGEKEKPKINEKKKVSAASAGKGILQTKGTKGREEKLFELREKKLGKKALTKKEKELILKTGNKYQRGPPKQQSYDDIDSEKMKANDKGGKKKLKLKRLNKSR